MLDRLERLGLELVDVQVTLLLGLFQLLFQAQAFLFIRLCVARAGALVLDGLAGRLPRPDIDRRRLHAGIVVRLPGHIELGILATGSIPAGGLNDIGVEARLVRHAALGSLLGLQRASLVATLRLGSGNRVDRHLGLRCTRDIHRRGLADRFVLAGHAVVGQRPQRKHHQAGRNQRHLAHTGTEHGVQVALHFIGLARLLHVRASRPVAVGYQVLVLFIEARVVRRHVVITHCRFPCSMKTVTACPPVVNVTLFCRPA